METLAKKRRTYTRYHKFDEDEQLNAVRSIVVRPHFRFLNSHLGNCGYVLAILLGHFSLSFDFPDCFIDFIDAIDFID